MASAVTKSIKELGSALRGSPGIELQNMTLGSRLNKRQQESMKDVTPQAVFYLHQEYNGLNISWTAREDAPADVMGSLKILEAKEVLKDWQGVVYFDFTPADSRIRRFHPIDFFVDEAAVGAFLNEPDREDTSLYLYSFEGEPANLRLDMPGYVQMMVASRCFLYWQYAILEILEGQENPVSQRFKEWMPRLFPEFDWQQYVAQYERVRL
jgi:hypothetical protein